MSWSMLNNGVCPSPGPEPLRFVSVSSGYYVNMAIDSAGRLYAWGSSSYQYQGQTPVAVTATPNFTRHPATFRADPYYEAMVYPYQTGATKSDWIDCQTVEYISMALDSEGYLYAVGEDAGGGSVYGRGGWAVGSQYNEVSNVFVPGGEQAIIMTLVNDQQWIKFILGAYHVLAQKADKSLWIWGKNLSDATYGTLTFPSNYVSLVPILMTWVPGPVKLFDAGYSVTAIVTDSNEVYAWGAWANTVIGTKQVPTLVPFSLPSGASIIDIKCNYSGIILLLSNGDVYGIGEYMGGTQPDEAMVFTKLPGGHYFVKIWAAVETGAAALDSSGVLWAWGNQSYLIVQGGTDDIVTGTPTFTGSSDPDLHRWVNFSAGSWSHLAIDDEGKLWSWGTPVYGLLGIGLFESESTEQYEAIECGIFATLDNGTLAYDEIVAGSVAVSITVNQPLPQLSAHNPCGHWHKGLDSAIQGGGYPENCWEPTIATNGTRALYVICGRHRPNEILMLNYQIAQNTWNTLLEREDVLHSNWDGGAALAGDVSAFHNYAYDISGEQYQEITSNPRMRTYVVNGSTVNITNWANTLELHGRNKVAVTAVGVVACIIRTSTNWQIHCSVNSGSTYSLVYTLPNPVTDAALVIDPDDGLVYVAAVADALLIYSGTSAGTGWALKSTTVVVDSPQSVRFHVDADRFFVAIQDQFYYSTDNCSSFLARDLQTPSLHFAGSGTQLYNLGDQQDYYTDDYEAVVITWSPITAFTPSERCTLHNHGDIAVFSQATMRNDSGNVVTILISFNLGQEWKEVSTPLNYYDTFEETLTHGDNPVWPFVPQWEKI